MRTCERRDARGRRKTASAGPSPGEVTNLAGAVPMSRTSGFPRRRTVRGSSSLLATPADLTKSHWSAVAVEGVVKLRDDPAMQAIGFRWFWRIRHFLARLFGPSPFGGADHSADPRAGVRAAAAQSQWQKFRDCADGT